MIEVIGHLFRCVGIPIGTTVTIDDALYGRALEVADPAMDKADLFREGMKVFVPVRAARRLAALGTNMPETQETPRRREEIGEGNWERELENRGLSPVTCSRLPAAPTHRDRSG